MHPPAEGNFCDDHGNTLKEATVKDCMSNRPLVTSLWAVYPKGAAGYIPRGLKVYFLYADK
jgi:hypothetical protein